ncbi:MAG: hypothetical protein O3B00_04400 [archaeon]|jgi:hypothetical protein|nr:hypothetical protein [archaeon]MDA1130722.1 hypothetical protein [archaeon]
MDEQQRPLLTLCKSTIIDGVPEWIDEKSLALMETLSGLCSFYNANDLATFLFSEMFDSLVGNDQPWIVFELGIFRDHKKMIEVIAVKGNITLADSQSTGVFDNDIVVCNTSSEAELAIMRWHDFVYDESGRFQ